MMDVREKLVEILEPHMSGLACEYEGGSCELTSCRSCNAKNIADHLIANGVTVQEWISVDDRLPEDSNDGFADAVLVTDGFVQHMAYFVGGEWRFAESGEIKEPMWYRITHWMPLPERPKGE